MVSSCCGGRTLQDDAYIDKLTSKTLTRALTHRSTAANALGTNVRTEHGIFNANTARKVLNRNKKQVFHIRSKQVTF